MITKIHKTQQHSSNKGSSQGAIDYLEKENDGKYFHNQEHFFNQYSDKISGLQAQKMLDNNKGRLAGNETKFYMLTLSPSKHELKHIGHDNSKLKAYTNLVMDQYARNFNRNYKNGEPLRGKDLVYFAKLETQRTYKFSNKKDREVLETNSAITKKIDGIKKQIIKSPSEKKKLDKLIDKLNLQYMRNAEGKIIREGVLKDGDNRHIHVLVHRYDAQQKFKLSPLSNAKNTKNKEIGKSKSVHLYDWIKSNGKIDISDLSKSTGIDVKNFMDKKGKEPLSDQQYKELSSVLKEEGYKPTQGRKQVQAGFDREKFVLEAERTFDRVFSYNREYNNSFASKMSKGINNAGLAISAINNPYGTVKGLIISKVTREIKNQIKNDVARKAFGVSSTNPKHLPKKALRQVEKNAVKMLMKSAKLGAYTNPATAVADVVLSAFKQVGRTISRSAGI